MNDSVGALNVALVAAVAGWLMFSICHAVAVWRKRNHAADGKQQSFGVLWLGSALLLLGLLAGWLNSQLTRRAGVILGTDFYVVRAHSGATAHLIPDSNAHAGEPLATFEDPEASRHQEELRREIVVLQQQIAVTRLRPLVLNPELLRVSQQAEDSQRARFTQLGYGVLPTASDSGSARPTHDEELVAAQRARELEAASDLARTKALVEAGVVPRRALDGAQSAAMVAAQNLRERTHLIEAARTGSSEVSRAEEAILSDRQRARLEQSAEVGELEARIAEFESSILLMQKERLVIAPFVGTIVYRHPAPALAAEGQVILALAKGPGFQATVQIPTREATMLVPGQMLRMKLQQALVSEEVSGRLQSIQPVSGEPGSSDLLIQCDLPGEQFAALSSGAVRVHLQWHPPFYRDRYAQFGFACLPLSLLAFLIQRNRTGKRALPSDPETLSGVWSKAWSYSAKEEEVYRLGIKFGEQLDQNAPSLAVIDQVKEVLRDNPVTSVALLKEGLTDSLDLSDLQLRMMYLPRTLIPQVDGILRQLDLRTEECEVRPNGQAA